jgi:hypothetical protein
MRHEWELVGVSETNKIYVCRRCERPAVVNPDIWPPVDPRTWDDCAGHARHQGEDIAREPGIHASF